MGHRRERTKPFASHTHLTISKSELTATTRFSIAERTILVKMVILMEYFLHRSPLTT